ncbi:MAG: hypothetical protein ACT4OT_06160 [Acidobacteriota bacterium]
MRLKLVFFTSLIASLLAVSFSFVINAVTIGVFSVTGPKADRWVYLVLSLPALLLAVLGGSFVYRHTATRRKLQTSLTVMLVLLLCLVELIALERLLD